MAVLNPISCSFIVVIFKCRLERILPDQPFSSRDFQVLWSLPYSLQSYFRPTRLTGERNVESVVVCLSKFHIIWLTIALCSVSRRGALFKRVRLSSKLDGMDANSYWLILEKCQNQVSVGHRVDKIEREKSNPRTHLCWYLLCFCGGNISNSSALQSPRVWHALFIW